MFLCYLIYKKYLSSPSHFLKLYGRDALHNTNTQKHELRSYSNLLFKKFKSTELSCYPKNLHLLFDFLLATDS